MLDPLKQLTIAFRERNLADFMHALEFLNGNPNQIIEENGPSLFQKILTTPNSADYIRLCIENGADCYTRASNKKFPLHFVLNSKCPKNLKQFLKNYDQSKINVKYHNENSLHLLIHMINDSNYENVAECIKILLLNGCNPNYPNDKNHTPFFDLLEKQKTLLLLGELVQFFVSNAEVDVYTYHQEKMIENFKYSNKKLQLPQQHVQNIDPKFMFSLAVKCDELKFESYFKAFREQCYNNEQNYHEECAKLLEMATIKGAPNIVDLILQNVSVDVNVRAAAATWNCPPTFIACKQGFYKILEIFLKQQKIVFTFEKPKEFPLEKNTSSTLLHEVCLRFGADKINNEDVDFQKCFDMLINDPRCDINTVINAKDSYGCTPIHYTTRYKNEVATMALLKKSAYLCIPNNLGQLALNEINRDTFERFLDEAIVPINRRKKQTHMYVYGYDEQELHIDYSFLMPPENSSNSEITMLRRITKNTELKKLIKHPTLFSFLYIKWSKLSLLFNINFFMFAMFLLSFITYIVLCQSLEVDERKSNTFYMFFYGISIAFVFVLLAREILQCLFSPKYYFRSRMNWFEITLIVLSFLVLFGSFEEDFQRILRGITILFAAAEFLFLAGTLPNLSISTHMVILRTVILTFLKSISLYSILLFGFAFCFYTLFGYDPTSQSKKNSNATEITGDTESKANPSFLHPGIAIIKTFVMLTGELEFSDLELHDYSNYIIFVLFVFLITIVLFNLLNALAVSDTQQIKAEGQLVDLIQRISVLNKYEKVINNGKSAIARWFTGTTNIFNDWIPTGKIVVFLNEDNEIKTIKTVEKVARDLGDEEMQTLNNNNAGNASTPKYENIIVNAWLPIRKFHENAKMDHKIMKSIRHVLIEKKNREIEEEKEAYRKKIDQKILRDIINIKIQNYDNSETCKKILNETMKSN
ncbi:hypothetical protein PVAND_002315 [Polypedilum vanderplanki]|uniref:Ion transport domain-containing protein n=1 Tax=Polypedilum vanderplanki TaxID=319348 RepID=A0A9J6BQY6_POLVA|nr:hypothetical protein PVAND_002315 [Polypedilum vanderplanki]